MYMHGSFLCKQRDVDYARKTKGQESMLLQGAERLRTCIKLDQNDMTERSAVYSLKHYGLNVKTKIKQSFDPHLTVTHLPLAN